MTTDNNPQGYWTIHGPRCGNCFGFTPAVERCLQCKGRGMVEPIVAEIPEIEAYEIVADRQRLQKFEEAAQIIVDKITPKQAQELEKIFHGFVEAYSHFQELLKNG